MHTYQKKWIHLSLGLAAVLLFTGCTLRETVKQKYTSIRQDMKGNHYLKEAEYERGIEAFQEELDRNPNSAEAHYYMGRFQLAKNRQKQAMEHLYRAAKLSPDEPDYHFWLGVAYAANNRKDLERTCYLNTLKLDDRHEKALTYLGHNHLEKQEYAKALRKYDKVLEINPKNPSALYNRAIILRHFKRTPEEIIAWKSYLSLYLSAPMARLAVRHLNELGDFEYRNFLIGKQKLPLRRVDFDPFSVNITGGSYQTLDAIGKTLARNRNTAVHIVVYQKNNMALAKRKALCIKKYFLESYPTIRSSRLVLSWMDVAEEIKIGRKRFLENETINFFTAVERKKTKKNVSAMK